MSDDGKELLRTSLQACLRQMYMSEVCTSRLLTVPRTHLHTLVPTADVKGLACADQQATLVRCLGVRQIKAHRHNLECETLQYEPNVRGGRLLPDAGRVGGR